MTDVHSPHIRSKNMAAIRSKNNKTTEMEMQKILRNEGLSGWRRHMPLPGKPDFAWPKKKVVLFIDGCFWHGCERCYRAPKSNIEYWSKKVATNRSRDKKVTTQLKKQGWSVLRVPECMLKNSGIQRILGRLRKLLVRKIT